MRETFNQKLSEIKQNIIKMGHKTEEYLNKTISDILQNSTQIDSIYSEIASIKQEAHLQCKKLFIHQQPVFANDLAFVHYALDITSDLESINNVIYRMSKLKLEIQNISSKNIMQNLSECVKTILHKTIIFIENDNIDLITIVKEKQSEVLETFENLKLDLISNISSNSSNDNIKSSVNTILIAYSLNEISELSIDVLLSKQESMETLSIKY